MTQHDEIATLALRVCELAGLIVLAFLHRGTRREIGDRVSAVGLELGRVRSAVVSSLRPPALLCSGCEHPAEKHSPRIERSAGQHRVTNDHVGPCVAPFCCCPSWQAPAEFFDEDTPMLPEGPG